MNWVLFIGVWLGLMGWGLFLWGAAFGGARYWRQKALDYQDWWKDERLLNRSLMRSRDKQAVTEAETYLKDAVNRE